MCAKVHREAVWKGWKLLDPLCCGNAVWGWIYKADTYILEVCPILTKSFSLSVPYIKESLHEYKNSHWNYYVLERTLQDFYIQGWWAENELMWKLCRGRGTVHFVSIVILFSSKGNAKLLNRMQLIISLQKYAKCISCLVCSPLTLRDCVPRTSRIPQAAWTGWLFMGLKVWTGHAWERWKEEAF